MEATLTQAKYVFVNQLKIRADVDKIISSDKKLSCLSVIQLKTVMSLMIQ